ncbi:MAG: ribonuclease P protein component [Arenicellales bacterium]|nr:ribonuclease P protein component [Arenicellales bacterium]
MTNPQRAAPDSGRRFSSLQRLTEASDYRVLLRQRASSDDYFRLVVRPNALGYGRLGLTVSRRTAARAVDRNRIKRLIRESFRSAQNQIAGNDVLVMARRQAVSASNKTLRHSLEQRWRLMGN